MAATEDREQDLEFTHFGVSWDMCRTCQGKKGWNTVGRRIMYRPGVSDSREED